MLSFRKWNDFNKKVKNLPVLLEINKVKMCLAPCKKQTNKQTLNPKCNPANPAVERGGGGQFHSETSKHSLCTPVSLLTWPTAFTGSGFKSVQCFPEFTVPSVSPWMQWWHHKFVFTILIPTCSLLSISWCIWGLVGKELDLWSIRRLPVWFKGSTDHEWQAPLSEAPNLQLAQRGTVARIGVPTRADPCVLLLVCVH